MQRDKTENWGPERESHTLPPVSGLSEALAERAAPGRLKRLRTVCGGSAEDERKNRIKTGGAQAASGRITAVRSAGCFKGFHRAAKWGENMGMRSQGYVLGGKAV